MPIGVPEEIGKEVTRSAWVGESWYFTLYRNLVCLLLQDLPGWASTLEACQSCHIPQHYGAQCRDPLRDPCQGRNHVRCLFDWLAPNSQRHNSLSCGNLLANREAGSWGPGGEGRVGAGYLGRCRVPFSPGRTLVWSPCTSESGAPVALLRALSL